MLTDSDVIGTVIEGFKVTDLLGRGGMGVVYKARDMKLDRDVALKLMDPVLARDMTFMKRFWAEAKALARLQSPYIVSVYTLLESEHGVCIVMEYVKGKSLAEIIRNSGAIPVDRAVRIFKQLMIAFEHAHAAGIIHRDVKPGNIMVTDKDEVKVADFGLAKIFQRAGSTASDGAGMTMSNTVAGTLYYSSPEQIEGLSHVDHRGDIYSLGMTLYEALIGVVPFARTESDFSIREKIVKGKIPPPRSMKPHLPKEINAVVVKAIARSPDHRYQSATEMKVALEKIPLESRARARGRARIPWAILLGIGLFLLVVIGGIKLYPSLFPDDGRLMITTRPEGAGVYINRTYVGMTPLRVLVAPGDTRIRIEYRNYRNKDTALEVRSGVQRELFFYLEKNPPMAAVDTSRLQSSPSQQIERPSADRETTSSPVTGIQVDATPSTPVAVAAPGKPIEKTKKTAAGAIHIRTIPDGARISIDGKIITDAEMPYSLPPGEYPITVSSGKQTWDKTVSIAPGEVFQTTLNFTLMVKVRVVAFDDDGREPVSAKILVDGRPWHLETPTDLSLAFGFHAITVQHENYKPPPAVKQNFERDLTGKDALKFPLKKR